MTKFIDLFCGIGGFRLAMESIGGECVFSSDLNPHAQVIYEANFNEKPSGDITLIDETAIPDFDVLCAGFPCQAFSIAGRKKGFEDARGTLFFDLCRIAEAKKPKVLFLENVKHLVKHDCGRTFKTMLSILDELGYRVFWRILNAKDYGVPQHRERVIIVAVRKESGISFDFDEIRPVPSRPLSEFLDESFQPVPKSSYVLLDKSQIKKQSKSGLVFCGYMKKKTRATGANPEDTHLSRTHKQPNRIYDSTGTHPTLSSQETSGRYFVHHQEDVRKLNIDECFRIMGFPKEFKKIGPQGQLFARIGNSVCVSMASAVAREILNQIL